MATRRNKSDAPELTDEQLERARAARFVKSVRAQTELSQEAFAALYHINVARLRDWEQGRSTPDSAIVAYFKMIRQEPELVARVVG
ncbi:helix-turn-helix domain-containing protein [Parvibaculum sp.]|uniref:helix-turn-helix domain-containing protein n=1 Tax=Parvibaculum sp. TaxID=2024848 RepID=UPI00349FF7C3